MDLWISTTGELRALARVLELVLVPPSTHEERDWTARAASTESMAVATRLRRSSRMRMLKREKETDHMLSPSVQ